MSSLICVLKYLERGLIAFNICLSGAAGCWKRSSVRLVGRGLPFSSSLLLLAPAAALYAVLQKYKSSSKFFQTFMFH